MSSFVSGSIIAWSQQLPCSASSGSSGSHCLSFFSHKGPGLIGLDLLGLNASDLAVVEAFGVLAEALGETQDGVEADPTQTRRGTAAAAIDEVTCDGGEGILGGPQTKQGGIGTFGEVRAASDA